MIKNTVAISLATFILAISVQLQAFDFGRLGFGKKTDLRGAARTLEQLAKNQDLDTMRKLIDTIKADKKIAESAKSSLINYYNELARNVRNKIRQRQEYYQQKEELRERMKKNIVLGDDD